MNKRKHPFAFRLNPISQLLLVTLSSVPLVAPANPSTTVLPRQAFCNDTPDNWMPRVSVSGQYGNYGVGQVDLFTPFLGNDLGLVFFDLRATATAQSTQDYNGALGFRSIVGDANKAIVGAHLWDDRRHTQYGNFFNQGTVGVEYFGNIYSVTSNLYVPYGDRKQVAYTTGVTPFVTGHSVGYFENTAYESALRGIDVELGKQDWIDRHLRVYGDYYHFGEGSDSARMNGGRVRAEYIIENKWLDTMGSNVTLTASYQYDNINRSVGFAGIRLNIGKDYHPTDPLVGRLEEYIMRDDNIVTVIAPTESFRITDPNTFIFVDNTKPAGGDGTKEHPYNNEQEAITASKSGDIIYTFQGVGSYPLPSGGLDLKQNQVFFGSGSDYIFNHVVVLPATSAPTLSGRINVASNDTLNGLTISGQGTTEQVGIYGDNISNVAILNTTVQDVSGQSANGTNGGEFGGPGGTGGDAVGIQLTHSTNVLLSQVTVNHIAGGDANGGTSTGPTEYYIISGNGGSGGHATGIDLTGSSTVTLRNVSVTHIMGGDANGGVANGHYVGSYARGGNAGSGGNATGINLTGASTVALSQVSLSGITGGSANGGDAPTSPDSNSDNAYGGNGGIGGNAIGIKGISSLPATVTVTTLAGGSASGGKGTGAMNNTQGANGTAGSEATYQP